MHTILERPRNLDILLLSEIHDCVEGIPLVITFHDARQRATTWLRYSSRIHMHRNLPNHIPPRKRTNICTMLDNELWLMENCTQTYIEYGDEVVVIEGS